MRPAIVFMTVYAMCYIPCIPSFYLSTRVVAVTVADQSTARGCSPSSRGEWKKVDVCVLRGLGFEEREQRREGEREGEERGMNEG